MAPSLTSTADTAVDNKHITAGTPADLDLAASTASLALMGRTLHKAAPVIVAAKGLYLTLEDGRTILDSTAGAAVASIGHGDERVAAAIAAQLRDGGIAYANSMFFAHRAGEALARYLLDSARGQMAKVYFVSSGSEAMEAALKLARQVFVERGQPARTRFIARRGSYHGITLGALAVGGHFGRRKIYEPILSTNVSFVSPCNAYRGMREGETTEEYVERLAAELEAEFQRVGPETVCAFVAEPVVGAATGCVPSVPGYFQAMSAVCKRHGALLILDEVMCGMGRTGTLHAWEQEGVVPDIQTIGKGLGAGYIPLAALLINKSVVEPLSKGTGAFSHGQTFQGHPLACAAASEVQRIMVEEDLITNAHRMGKLLESELRSRLEAHPNVGNVRGRGLFWGIELVKDKTTKEPFELSEGVAAGINELGLNMGFSLYPGTGSADDFRGDHVILSPPYTITEKDVHTMVDLTAQAIEKFFKSKVR